MNTTTIISVGSDNNVREIFHKLTTDPVNLISNINEFATRVEYETEVEVWKHVARNGYTEGEELTISVDIDLGDEDLSFCERVSADDLESLARRADYTINEISRRMRRELCFAICCDPAFGMGEGDVW